MVLDKIKSHDKVLLVAQEITFAKVLACNDKKLRDRGLKRLNKWFIARSRGVNDFDKDGFIRLWQGLYYCMWMADKPLVQEDVAEGISALIHSLARFESASTFIYAFFKSLSDEWANIDQLRLDKFLMLVRRFLRQSFVLLKRHGWKTDHVTALSDVIYAVLNFAPIGLCLHLTEIYLEELAKVSTCCCSAIASINFSDKNSPCCQNCQYMSVGVKCREAQYATCEQESRCTGTSPICPRSPPMTDGTGCLERGQCRHGKCVPYCETQGLQSCMCDVIADACKRCCRMNLNDTCFPVDPLDILPDGTPCIQGFCNKGVCEKTIQDVVERFWDIIEDININKVLVFLRDNVVGTVILVTGVIWIPASCLVSYVDRRRLRREERRREWKKNDHLMYPVETNTAVINLRVPRKGASTSSSKN